MTVYEFGVTSIDYKEDPTNDRPNRITFSEATTGNEQNEYKNDEAALDRHNATYKDAAVFMTNIKHIGGADKDGQRTFEADAISIKDAHTAFDKKYNPDNKHVVKPLFVMHGYNNEAGYTLNLCKQKQKELNRRANGSNKKIILIPVIWPTIGGALDYTHDRDYNVEEAAKEFKKLLGGTIAAANEFENKSLLVHSMGNQVMRELASSNVKFDNIFLAAADVRYDIFEKEYIEKSGNDFALQIYRMLEQDGKFKGKLYPIFNYWDYALNISDSVAVNNIYRLGQYGIEKDKLPSSINGNHIENFNARERLSWGNQSAHSYQFESFLLDLYWQKMM
mmetsp:Transcript_36803/g.42341  ORF Transcript_36803/g.42341 Transcript_36803/m.42341 type:complete len:335 (+) Transcript_36803:44-1048(+)|eukprot:CAMPEP_0170945606 /NCGR_PEP_ID=MMETSP0735-20130129/26553_1 /TAXON_ID=186038 /ORGANISM="Fragilariopsis kerguelensis, Strain L26-C5" /LENGTH=334 /DNA_ID=CAMNT_0011354057 /DNA_START=150 /DNA_END=1154 /DNA_ORIENTATION=+